jgi:hypothetical protein
VAGWDVNSATVINTTYGEGESHDFHESAHGFDPESELINESLTPLLLSGI